MIIDPCLGMSVFGICIASIWAAAVLHSMWQQSVEEFEYDKKCRIEDQEAARDRNTP